MLRLYSRKQEEQKSFICDSVWKMLEMTKHKNIDLSRWPASNQSGQKNQPWLYLTHHLPVNFQCCKYIQNHMILSHTVSKHLFMN